VAEEDRSHWAEGLSQASVGASALQITSLVWGSTALCDLLDLPCLSVVHFTCCIPAETDHLRRNPSISQAGLLPTLPLGSWGKVVVLRASFLPLRRVFGGRGLHHDLYSPTWLVYLGDRTLELTYQRTILYIEVALEVYKTLPKNLLCTKPSYASR